MGHPFAQEVVLQVAQQEYFVIVGPHLLLPADDRFELVQVFFELVLVRGKPLDVVDAALPAQGAFHLPEQLDAVGDVLFGGLRPVSVVAAKRVAGHFGHRHDPASGFGGSGAARHQIVRQAVVDGMHPQVAQAFGLVGGDAAALGVTNVNDLAFVSMRDPAQFAVFLLAPPKPANGLSGHFKLQLLQPGVNFRPQISAPVTEQVRGQRLRAAIVIEEQHLVAGLVRGENLRGPDGGFQH